LLLVQLLNMFDSKTALEAGCQKAEEGGMGELKLKVKRFAFSYDSLALCAADSLINSV